MPESAPLAAVVAFTAFGANLLGGALLLLFNPRNRAVRWYVAFVAAQLVWLGLQGLMLTFELPAAWHEVYVYDVHFLPALFCAATLVQVFRPPFWIPLLPLAAGVLVLPLMGAPLDSSLTHVWQGLAWGFPALLYFRYGSARRGRRQAPALNIALSVVVPLGVIASIMLRGGFIFFALPVMTIFIQFLIFTGIVHYRFYDVEVRAARSGELAAGVAERDRLALLGELAATVAHEVRNPLTGIRSLTQRIGEGPLPDETRERYVDVILGEIARLDRIVGNLTDLARLQPPATAALEPTPLAPLFEDLALLVETRARRADVRLAVRANGVQVSAPREALAQALLNLLLNAIAHAPAGSTVELGATAVDGQVVLTVSDQGSGIPASERERIFAPFHTAGGGTGLGLAVVRALARQHQWRIEVVDAVPHGAELRILVPPAAAVPS